MRSIARITIGASLACICASSALLSGQARAGEVNETIVESKRISVIAISSAGSNPKKASCLIDYWTPEIGTDIAPATFPCGGQSIDQGRGTYTKLRYGAPSQSGDYPFAYFNTEMKRVLNSANVLTTRPTFDEGRVTSLVYNLDRFGNVPAIRPSSEKGRTPRWLCMNVEDWKRTDDGRVAAEWKTYRILTYRNGKPITVSTKQGCSTAKQGMKG